MQTQNLPDHEKIFNEICLKLNELSQSDDEKLTKEKTLQLEKMQNQLKNFQFDLVANQEDMKIKIETLEKMTVSNSDLSVKIQELTDSLNLERASNSKLSSDLAKSLDLSLRLQLEIQDIKAKSMQAQIEDRKQYQDNHDLVKYEFQKHKSEWADKTNSLNQELSHKQNEIAMLNQKINEIEKNMNMIESTSNEQKETIDHLVTVAESKIIELKLSSDRACADRDNLSGQLKKMNSQVETLSKENYALKDYINKMTVHYQNYQQQLLHISQQTQQSNRSNS